MLSSIAFTTLRRAAPVVMARTAVASTAPTMAARAVSARYANYANYGATTARFMSSSEKPFAVDAPDGDHDLQDVEECGEWSKRVVDIASITEDADAITKMHDAVLGDKKTFAVDAPDGEHDLEDVEEHHAGVKRIIDEAYLFENPEDVKLQQEMREEARKEAIKTTEHDM